MVELGFLGYMFVGVFCAFIGRGEFISGGEFRAMAGEDGVERVVDFLCFFRYMVYFF